jgi:UDP-arabinose 4-epimerase
MGEDRDPETHLIPLAIFAALGVGPALSVFGSDYATPDGSAIRDYIHVSDLASAHVCALDRLSAGASRLRLNLGTGTGYSVRQVVRMVEEVGGRPVPVIEAPRREGDPPELVAATGLATKELQWTPQNSDLRNIVDTAWRWHTARHAPVPEPSAAQAIRSDVAVR